MSYLFLLHLPDKEVARLQKAFGPTKKKLEAIGFFCHQQTLDRFRTQGVSGGAKWPQKVLKSLGYDDGRAILTGMGGAAGLLQSFYSYGATDDNMAVVASESSYAHMHQLGTVGKGGVLPTIRPKKAKALFIPITDRAIQSMRLTPEQAGTKGPLRVAVKYHKKKGSTFASLEFVDLVKGRIKDGRLQKWDAKRQEWLDGTPDFIFLRKSDLPPRPMLPDSQAERDEQTQFIADLILTRDRDVRVQRPAI